MSLKAAKRIAFVSSYKPRRCGIAMFTSDLINNVGLAGGDSFEPAVIAMKEDVEHTYDESVELCIRRTVISDYTFAADYINCSDVDLVSLQHEFGLFGGPCGAGEYLNNFLNYLEVPIVTTLHTVLNTPTREQYRMVRSLACHSHKLVLMSHTGIDLLKRVYGISSEKIKYIPHGVPNIPQRPVELMKQKLGLAGRTTILTAGLLGPGKGIETLLLALPDIVRQVPNVLYILLGATHPNLVHSHGETYRERLVQLVCNLNLERHVRFYDAFVSQARLCEYLAAADIYVTPYPKAEQVTSGTLAYAIGAGCVVVSTPYWHAKELLADGGGCLVPSFGDASVLAEAIISLVKDPSTCRRMRRQAYLKGRKMIWPVVGKTYSKLFSDVKGGVADPAFTSPPAPLEKHYTVLAS